MSLTTDREDPRLHKIEPSGMQEAYLVLSDEERALGFVRPLRASYKHLACGNVTTMGLKLSETYARDPKFYGGTFCAHCGNHFDLWERKPGEDGPYRGHNFIWTDDGDPVGS